MCTTCGYRGNTSRGVKQHGKMHLSAHEHFAIINAKSHKPYIVYNSLEDANLLHNHHGENSSGLKRPISGDFIDVNNETTSNSEHSKTADESNEASSAAVANNNGVSSSIGQQPFTKKARLLEYNNNSNKNDDDDESEDDSQEVLTNKIERPQTFCHKCSTQFKQIVSFKAHKKFYCMDD